MQKITPAIFVCLAVFFTACHRQSDEPALKKSPSADSSATLKSNHVEKHGCFADGAKSLIISELVHKSDVSNYLDGRDWLELLNAGPESVNLSHYSLALETAELDRVSLPDTLLAPCDYLVIPAGPLKSAPDEFSLPFSFKKHGTVSLYSGEEKIDELVWSDGDSGKGQSIGRLNGQKTTLYPTPGYANVPYVLFSDDKVFTVKIDLTEDHWNHLLRNAPREHWYPAVLTFNGAIVKNVYVRTKGSSTLNSIAQLGDYHESRNRFSFKVKFNKDIDQKFMGMKRLAFNNGYGDPTLMRDMFAYQLLKTVGAPASDISYVDLWVRDKHMGLYQMVELVDSEYVEKYFPDDAENDLKGDLYKAFSALQWKPEYTLKHYTRGRYPELELKTNRHTIGTEDEGKALMAFLKSINTGSADAIDIDTMARYTAAMALISNYDSYFANLGNYYLYEHRSIKAFTMLPWDFNLGLGRSIKDGKTCEDPVVSIDHPTIVPIEKRPMLARLFEREDFVAQYHQHLQTLLDTLFNPKDSRAFIQKKMDLIDPYVKADITGFYSYGAWKRSFTERVVGGTDHFGPAGPLLPFIDARYEHVRRQLNGEVPTKNPQGGSCADVDRRN